MTKHSKDFYHLLYSQLFANTGDILTIVGLIAVVYNMTSQTTAASLIPIIFTIGIFVSSFMEWIKLIGILIIIIGFILKFDTIAIILIAAVVTGLVAGMDIVEVLSTLGKAFVDQRLVTLFMLTLPMVGLIERFGLKQQASKLISNVKKITTGRLLTLYLIIREIAGVASIRIGGHPQFVRPLINPMVQGALRTRFNLTDKDIDEKDIEKLKAEASAMENYGNFFGQNLFVGAAGVLLMVGTFQSLDIKVNAMSLVLASIPIAIITLILVWIKNILLDRYFNKKYGHNEVKNHE